MIVSDAATGTGPGFDFPIGVMIDRTRNRALIANYFSGAIIAVNLASGNRTIFSAVNSDPMLERGTGPALNWASGIAADGGDTIFVSGEKLWAIEVVSGDRVIVGD
jgi:hypothetical protein